MKIIGENSCKGFLWIFSEISQGLVKNSLHAALPIPEEPGFFYAASKHSEEMTSVLANFPGQWGDGSFLVVCKKEFDGRCIQIVTKCENMNDISLYLSLTVRHRLCWYSRGLMRGAARTIGIETSFIWSIDFP